MWKRIWQVLRSAVVDFIADDVLTLGAALSYYTALSLAPLLIILLWVGGLLGPEIETGLVDQIVEVIGPRAGDAVRLILEGADDSGSAGTIAGIFGIGVLVFSATSVFAQLQYSLNRIWNVQARVGAGVGSWFRKRLLSLGMVMTLAFLMLVSLAVNAALAYIAVRSSDLLPGAELFWRLVNTGVSVVVFTLLFASFFKILPDVTIGWRDVAVGAALTAILFALGKGLISLYLAQTSVGSSYGAAGSLLVLLVWVYFSSLVLFFGAEITQAWTKIAGHPIRPDRHADWVRPPEDLGFREAADDEPAADGSVLEDDDQGR